MSRDDHLWNGIGLMKLPRIVSLILLVVAGASVWADGPADNNVATVRPVPSPGVMIAPSDREALEAGLKQLTEKVVSLQASKSPLIQK